MSLIIIILALLVSLIRLRRHDYTAISNRMARRSRDNLILVKPCPICGTLLHSGERVHTHVYSGVPESRRKNAPEESIVHMFGCPYCYPPNRSYTRYCPVCGTALPDDGYLVARMFTRNERKHVHVLGCTVCREGTANAQARNSR